MLVKVIISVLLAVMIYANNSHDITYHSGESDFHTLIHLFMIFLLFTQQYALFSTCIEKTHFMIAGLISLVTTIAIAEVAILLAHIHRKAQRQKKDEKCQ